MAKPLPFSFRARGKFLLTSEYFVLDGAQAIALPLNRGQSFHIQKSLTKHIEWFSFDLNGQCWFNAQFNPVDLSIIQSTDNKTAIALQKILQSLGKLPLVRIESKLDFPRDWGLGSSSTLIYAMAKWAGIDPYELLEKTFGGSGYDLACAGANGPILYTRKKKPEVIPLHFQPHFAGQLYFVYLGHKQNSREGIQRYRKHQKGDQDLIEKFSKLSAQFLDASDLNTLEKHILTHEQLVAKALQLDRAQDLHFSDYWGQTKSLGAWGGDFVLATSNRSLEATFQYFHQKGFDTVIPYLELTI